MASRSRSPPRFASDVAEDDIDLAGEALDVEEFEEAEDFEVACSTLPWVPSAWSNLHPCEIPEGPRSFVDLHDWPQHQWHRLGEVFGEAAVQTSVQRMLMIGFMVTTHYSGMGTFEITCGVLLAWLTHLGVHRSSELGDVFRMYSASDIDELCIHVLGSHRGMCAPEHIFGDICHALPRGLIKQWQVRLRKYRSRVQSHARDPAHRRELIDAYWRAFVRRALVEMRQVKIPKNVRHWCYKHNRHCRHFHTRELNCKLHVEAAGTTCVGFSPLGTNWRWLDDSCVAFLSWIALMWVSIPDIIIHECVPSFDADLLEFAFNFLSEEDCRYVVRSVCFSTRDQGVPIDRRRRYSLCNRIVRINISKYNLSYFSLVTFRRLEINGSIFFQATAGRLEQVKEEIAHARGLPAQSNGRPWPWRALLTASENQMLQSMHHNGVVDRTGEAFVTLSQNWHRQSTYHDCVPALTRNSKIYRTSPVCKDDRPAIADEYFGMQMMPMFLPEDHVSRSHFSPEDFKRAGAFELGKARRLTGNGMNIEAVGSVLLCALALAELPDR